MATPDGDTESIVSRLRGSQRTLTVLVLVLALVGSATIVVAQPPAEPSEFTFEQWEDYEDQTLGSWSSTATIINDGYGDQEYSIRVNDQTQSTGPVVELDSGEATVFFRHKFASTFGSTNALNDLDYRIGGTDNFHLRWDGTGDPSRVMLGNANTDASNGPHWTGFEPHTWYNYYVVMGETEHEVYIWQPSEPVPDTPRLTIANTNQGSDASGQFVLDVSHDHRVDAFAWNKVPPSGVEGTVTDEGGNELANVTVEASVNGTTEGTAETDGLGQYELSLENGTYNLTASKQGYFPESETVTVAGDIVRQDFQLTNHSSALNIHTRVFLRHGQSAPYSVTFEKQDQSGRLTRTDVTDNSTVTSGDTSIVTVNPATGRVTATSDTSVNNRTMLTAEYTDPSDGETYTTQHNITVANLTVDNLDILPPVERFAATISGGTAANPSDRTIQVILIGMGFAVAASIAASAFAGLATLTMAMLMGWIMGFVGNGVAIVTVFVCLFISLNLAGNVDYTIRR